MALDDASNVQRRGSSKQGFSVGPANLPDGVHKRKVQKIKKRLIEKAKIKKAYSKLKDREARDSSKAYPVSGQDLDAEAAGEPGSNIHPERQQMLDTEDVHHNEKDVNPRSVSDRHRRRPKREPFNREAQRAVQQRKEHDARTQQIQEANLQRENKREEREKFRSAMAKARSGGKDHRQRKLGRESKVLLAKVQRMMDD